MREGTLRPLPLAVDTTQSQVTATSTCTVEGLPNHQLDAGSLEQFDLGWCFKREIVRIGEMDSFLLFQAPDQAGIVIRKADTGIDRSAYGVNDPLVVHLVNGGILIIALQENA